VNVKVAQSVPPASVALTICAYCLDKLNLAQPDHIRESGHFEDACTKKPPRSKAFAVLRPRSSAPCVRRAQPKNPSPKDPWRSRPSLQSTVSQARVLNSVDTSAITILRLQAQTALSMAHGTCCSLLCQCTVSSLPPRHPSAPVISPVWKPFPFKSAHHWFAVRGQTRENLRNTTNTIFLRENKWREKCALPGNASPQFQTSAAGHTARVTMERY